MPIPIINAIVKKVAVKNEDGIPSLLAKAISGVIARA